MNLNKIFRIFGYFVSVVLIIFGTILVTGIHIPMYASIKNIPDQPRIVFGVVFFLYGVYRGVRLLFYREQKEEEESDSL
jgi:uncharacterized membrane protein